MIYNYEKALADIFKDMGMKSVAYADDETVFRSLVKVLTYPSVWFERETQEWVLSKKIPALTTKGTENDLLPLLQNYTAHFLVETQGEALKLAAKLRYYFLKHPRVRAKYSEGVVDVNVFVTGITVESQRDSYDMKGSQREVTMKWWSQLFFEESTEDKVALVETFRIFWDDSMTVEYNKKQ